MTDDRIPIGQYMYAVLWPRIEGRKTDRWGVYSAKDDFQLGTVAWFFRWRQYVFTPSTLSSSLDPTFNAGCLEDLSGFLRDVNKNHRSKKRLDK